MARNSAATTYSGSSVFHQSSKCWLLLALLMLVPFFLAPIPPFPDFPGHVAQYHIMLNLHRSTFLPQFYDFNWTLAGNQGVDILMLIAGPLLGIERAAWAMAAATPFLMVFGIFAVSRAIHGRVQLGAFLALPFVYAKAFLWGFLNYDLSVAAALLAFALWIHWRGQSPWRALVFCLIGLALWVCHAAGWGLLCLMAGGYELAAAIKLDGWRFASLKPALFRLGPLIPPALLSLNMVQHSATPYPIEITSSGLPHGLLAYKLLIFVGQLHDRMHSLDLLSVLTIAVLFLLSRRNGTKLVADLFIPAILVALAAILIPQKLSGSAFADYRIAPVAILLFFLSLRSGTGWDDRAAVAFALALTGVRLAVTAVGWHQDAIAYERHLGALNVVPMGARLLVLVPLETAGSYNQLPLGHLGDIAVARRDALVNSQWINTGAIALTIKANKDSAFYADPSQYIAPEKLEAALASASRKNFDFAWVLGGQLTEPMPANLDQIYHDEETRLFRIRN